MIPYVVWGIVAVIVIIILLVVWVLMTLDEDDFTK